MTATRRSWAHLAIVLYLLWVPLGTLRARLPFPVQRWAMFSYEASPHPEGFRPQSIWAKIVFKNGSSSLLSVSRDLPDTRFGGVLARRIANYPEVWPEIARYVARVHDGSAHPVARVELLAGIDEGRPQSLFQYDRP